MRKHNRLFIFVINIVALLFILSCKKEVKQPTNVSIPDPVLAPCELEENFLLSEFTDTVRYTGYFISNTPDTPYENCHYYVRLKTNNPNVKTHLYFKEEPKSGIYIHAVGMILDSDTTMALRHDCFGLNVVTFPSGEPIYVNNQDGVITISYCVSYLTLDTSTLFISPSSGKITFKK